MELFLKLFNKFINFTYSCFDRMILNGYIVNLLKENNIIYFFKKVNKDEIVDKNVLKKRTDDYNNWVEAYSQKNKIPLEWSEKGSRKEDVVKPYLGKMKRLNKTGVYYIMKSMEIGTTYRCINPKYKTKDPNYRIIKKHRSRYTHYYFYIYDEILGNMSVKVGSYLPFNTVYYINGHNFIEQELKKCGMKYRMEDNAFLAPSDSNTIKEIADRFSPDVIRKQLDYWSFVVSPKFSKKERQMMNLSRTYYISQIEYSINLIFKRNLRVKELFQRICQSGIAHISYNTISEIFGHRISRRLKGKLSSTLEKYKESMHVFRIHFKNSVLKQYHKSYCFLRNELVCNDLKNFGLKKSLDNLPNIKEHFAKILDNFTEFQGKLGNINFSSDIFNELSKPVLIGKVKVPGIKIENERIIRLMEFLLRFACGFNTFKTKDIYNNLLQSYSITEQEYTFGQLQYDIRKLKAHGIIERIGKTYNYKLSDFGKKVCMLFTVFRKAIYGPLQNQQFVFKQDNNIFRYESKFDNLYRKIEKNIYELCKMLAA
jgi:hypothetical protein